MDLPTSMNGNKFEKGCPGAVWYGGQPSFFYCKKANSWWAACCDWTGPVGGCKPKCMYNRYIYFIVTKTDAKFIQVDMKKLKTKSPNVKSNFQLINPTDTKNCPKINRGSLFLLSIWSSPVNHLTCEND